MIFDADDYSARVLEHNPVPGVDSDSSKWTAIRDALDSMPPTTPSSSPGSIFTVAWVLGIALSLVWVLRNGRTVFGQWQENVYRRANRRRHGIPDDDDRPFNVAYAAAAVARRQQEEQEKRRVGNSRRELPQRESERATHGNSIALRQRAPQSATSFPLHSENGQSVLLQGSSRNSLNKNGSTSTTKFSPYQPTDPRTAQSYNRYDLRQPGLVTDRLDHQPELSRHPIRSSSVDHSNRRYLDLNGSEPVPPERRKHHELDHTDEEDRLSKKSRVADDGVADGLDDAAWVNMPGGSQRGSLQIPKRGSKRLANEEADDDWEMSQDKRPRKGSATHTSDAEDVLDVDMADESDMEPARGTKRDREDAESIADSVPYDTDDSRRSRPARKRRTDRKDEFAPQGLPSRGRKRDRSHDGPISSDDEDDESDARIARHKRGRQLEEHEETEEDVDIVTADASESDAEVSLDPACGGRRVGETWEVNGQSFKVGLDGRRLRHALIKQTRTKFPMPKDSAHRDAITNVDIIVEKWLNDDEYKAAKESYELAWQDVSPISTPDKAKGHARYEELPSSGGKRLLWGGPPPSPIKGRSSLRSASNVQNPFDLAPNNTRRRVTSTQLLNNQMESPKLRSSKSFSKWEKQDLEASSLKKMRARMEKQKAEAAVAMAAAKPSAPAPAPTPLASTTNTLSQPPAKTTPDSTKPMIPSFNAGPPANPFAKPVSETPVVPNPTLSLGKLTNAPLSTSAQLPSASPASASQTLTAPIAPTVQAASKPPFPSFQFAPGPASGSTPSSGGGVSTNPKPSFSFTPSSAVQPASSALNVAPAVSTPTLTFGPSKEAKKSESPFNFSAGTTPSEPGKSGVPNIFGKPTSQVPAVSAPASVSSGAFSFTSGSQAAQSNLPAKPTFQFGVTGEKSNAPSSGGAGSLLSRLAPTSSSAPQASQSIPPQTSWPSTLGGGQTASATATMPLGNPFGQQGSQSQPQSAPSNPSLSNPFGQQQQSASKPTLFSSDASPNTNTVKSNPFGTSSLTLASGGVGSMFSFAKPSGPTDAPTQPSPFSFQKPAAQPVQPTQTQPAFSFNFGGSSTQGNPSQAAPSSSTPSIFQPPSTGGAQGQSGIAFDFGKQSASSKPNPFGGIGSKPPDTEKK